METNEIKCPACGSSSVLKRMLETLYGEIPCTCLTCGNTFTINVRDVVENYYKNDCSGGKRNELHQPR